MIQIEPVYLSLGRCSFGYKMALLFTGNRVGVYYNWEDHEPTDLWRQHQAFQDRRTELILEWCREHIADLPGEIPDEVCRAFEDEIAGELGYYGHEISEIADLIDRTVVQEVLRILRSRGLIPSPTPETKPVWN